MNHVSEDHTWEDAIVRLNALVVLSAQLRADAPIRAVAAAWIVKCFYRGCRRLLVFDPRGPVRVIVASLVPRPVTVRLPVFPFGPAMVVDFPPG